MALQRCAIAIWKNVRFRLHPSRMQRGCIVCNTLTTTKALSEDDRNSPGFRPTDGNDDDDLDAAIPEEGEYTQWWFCATNSIVLKWSIGVN